MRFPSSPAARQVVSLILVSVLLLTYLHFFPSRVARAFMPTNRSRDQLGLGNSRTHESITTEAITFLDKEYFGVSQTTENMKSAIREIVASNADVDTPEEFGGTQFKLSASHFDGENFPGSMRRLIDYKARIITLLNLNNPDLARWFLGQALHTLQDFYSHSNWVEKGETGPWSALGFSVSPFPPRNLRTCTDCIRNTCTDCDYNPATGVTNLTTQALTTGYYGGDDRQPPENFPFKCNHGGRVRLPIIGGIPFIGTRSDTSGSGFIRDGINKDTVDCEASPHWRKHGDAAIVAYMATVKYIDDIKNIVGLEKMRRLLGGGPTLAFAIDTTGSMTELDDVKAKVVQIVNSRLGTPLEPSLYILAPFNDPGVGPVLVTADSDEFLIALDDLIADGGGDCPELAYTAMLKVVFDNRMRDGDLIVFTDAGAKDAQDAGSVNFFARTSRVRISIVYTGSALDCPISPEYFTTARETGGKVFEIAPSELQNVIVLADLMARPNLVGIWSFGGLLNGFTQTFFFNLDTTLTVSTLVVTGTGATNIVIRRPDGTILQPADFIRYVPLSTGLLASISSPVAGLWSISISGSPPSQPQTLNATAPGKSNPNDGGSKKLTQSGPEILSSTSSNGEFSIGVFGESESLQFNNFEFLQWGGHGPHAGTFPISSFPVAGQLALVGGDMVLNGGSAPQFQLRGMDDSVLQTFSLEEVTLPVEELQPGEVPKQFIGAITVPNVPFNIYATGLDLNGKSYQRLISGITKPQSVQVSPVHIEALYPGLTTTYTVRVKNTGPAGSFVVSASDDHGFIVGTPTTVVLAQDGTADVNFSVVVPTSAQPETLTNFNFTAESTTNPELRNILKIGPLRVGAVPALTLGTVTLTSLGGNGDANLDPGESGSLAVELINKSSVELTSFSATLSTASPGVTFTSAQSQYPDMPPDGFGTNTTPFTFDLASTASCGQILNFTLTVNYTGGSSQSVFNFSVTTGQPSATTTANYTGPPVAIPDNNATGVNIPLTVSGVPGNLRDINFRFDGSSCSDAQGSTTVGLDHTWVGDLVVKLTSPQGTTVTLIDRAGSSGNNFCNTVLDDGGTKSIQNILSAGGPYTGTFQPANPLSAFNGQNPNGTWTLNVSDRASVDIGSVRAFSLVIVGSQCASVPPSSCTLPAAGSLTISEFRLRGPAGVNDEFVELYNTTGAPLSVCTTDGSAGWAVTASDGTIKTVLLNGMTIPARAHYLIANYNPSDPTPRYSLRDYGGTNSATPDATYTLDIEDGAGLALFKSANPANFTPATRLDAVGFAGVFDTRFREGAGLQPSIGVAEDAEFTFFRLLNTGTHIDTNNNAADFMFVSTTAAILSGVQSSLGAPGPENLSSPIIRNLEIPAVLIDPAVPAASAPNRVRDLNDTGPNKTFGTLSIRRKLINNLGVPVTLLRFRVVNTTTLHSAGYSPSGGQADVRALSSGPFTVTITGGSTITVVGTTLETPPAQPLAGGHNATLRTGTISLSQPLAPGASVNLQFLLGVEKTGSFRFFFNVEAIP